MLTLPREALARVTAWGLAPAGEDLSLAPLTVTPTPGRRRFVIATVEIGRFDQVAYAAEAGFDGVCINGADSSSFPWSPARDRVGAAAAMALARYAKVCGGEDFVALLYDAPEFWAYPGVPAAFDGAIAEDVFYCGGVARARDEIAALTALLARVQGPVFILENHLSETAVLDARRLAAAHGYRLAV